MFSHTSRSDSVFSRTARASFARHADNHYKWSMAVLLAILAFLSFRDAWRYRNSGNSRDITLRLPDSIINRIHSVLRKRVTSGKLLIGALTAGFIVTLIESVCTGQLYLPTLVYLSGHEIHYKKALSLLLLYNLAFITPLILVLAAVYLGAKNNKLTKWSRNNAVQGKSEWASFS